MTYKLSFSYGDNDNHQEFETVFEDPSATANAFECLKERAMHALGQEMEWQRIIREYKEGEDSA